MKDKALYDISEVCNILKTTSRTLRFYEEKGIIQSSYISNSNRRQYTKDQINHIRNVLVLRTLGLSIKSIYELQQNNTDLKNLILSKRAEIYATIDKRNIEICLLNEALSIIESGKDIFKTDLQQKIIASSEEKQIVEICSNAIVYANTEELYKYLSPKMIEYSPKSVYEIVRKDTLLPLGDFISFEKTVVDSKFPNRIYKYAKFSKLGLKITYVNDNQEHPAVLLISGSGPCDYNETIGVLTPFEDIALGLAQNGINSLRIDKRTLNYASELGNDFGLEEEYISDCNAAIDYLIKQGNTEIKGMIVFNSSARHLADIACDQYIAADPSNKKEYISYVNSAKKASVLTSKGYYYFSASDYYLTTYNELDIIKNIQDANVKTLIINSTFDRQLFDEDIEMWKANFSDNENVSIQIFDDISHFGYKIDTTNETAIYTDSDFPTELVNVFSEFIKESQ